jgi:hypothetical protein
MEKNPPLRSKYPLIYVTGPLVSPGAAEGAPYFFSVSYQTMIATKVGKIVGSLGGIPILPHVVFGRFEDQSKNLAEPWVSARLGLLAGCSALVTFPGWEESDMVTLELQAVVASGMPFFHRVSEDETPRVFLRDWILDWKRLHG